MSGCTVKRIDEMEAIYGGAYKRARAELGVSAFGEGPRSRWTASAIHWMARPSSGSAPAPPARSGREMTACGC